jgi:hypothetical protein
VFATVIHIIESHRTVRWELSAGSISQSDKSSSQGHWHHGCYYPLNALPSGTRRRGGRRSSVPAACQRAYTEYRDPPRASKGRSRTTPGPGPGGVDACKSIVGPCHNEQPHEVDLERGLLLSHSINGFITDSVWLNNAYRAQRIPRIKNQTDIE